jgi:DNA-directed RNA polymerase specialized sigma subunit
MKKQEWFERYSIKHGIPETMLDNLRTDTMTTAIIDDWMCWKFACLRMAVDKLPKTHQKIIYHYYFMEEPPKIIAKQLRISIQNFYVLKDKAINELERQALINFFLKQNNPPNNT